MVGVVRHRASLCPFWCDRARGHWTDATWKRLRRNPGEKASGKFEDLTRGSRQGFDDLWLDRQKQRRRSHPCRSRDGIDSCRLGEAKAGAPGPIATPQPQATASASASAASPALATSPKPGGAQASPQAAAPAAPQGAAVSSPPPSPAAQASPSPAASAAPTSPSPAKSP